MGKIVQILKAVVGWTLTVALSASLGLIVGSWLGGRITHNSAGIGAGVGVLTMFVLLLGGSIFFVRACRKRGWDASGLGRAGLLAVGAFVLAIFVRDAPPIHADYTVRDLVPNGKDVIASRETLLTYRKAGPKDVKIAMTDDQLQKATLNALPQAKEVEQAWEAIAEARQVIDKLGTYDVIADVAPTMRIDATVPIMSFVAYRTIARVYWAYARLRLEQGKPEEAARELVRLQTAVRKAVPSMAVLVDKMIWVAIARQNLRTTHAVVTHPDVSRETLELLRQGFPALTMSDVCLRKSFIIEYVSVKTILQDLYQEGKLLDALKADGKPRRIDRIIASVLFPLALQPNRTLRALRDVTARLVRGADLPLPDVREADDWIRQFRREPRLGNIGGQSLIATAVPSYAKATATAVETKVLSDLLALELASRLGEKLECVDPYTGVKYAQDEKGLPFSVGPDRQPGTKDDITLSQP